VATPVRVGTLDAAEAGDLVEALAVRGLIGTPVDGEGGRWVELRSSREKTERLLADVADAVEAWLADRGRAALEIRAGRHAYSVRAGQRLDDVLRSRLPAASRRLGSAN
jgi:hypothetical protein